MSELTTAPQPTDREQIVLESRDIQEAAQTLLIVEGGRRFFRIADTDQANILSRLRQRIGKARQKIKDIWKPVKKKIQEAKDEAIKAEREMDTPLAKLDDALYVEIKRYAEELEAERRRKQIEADRKAGQEHRQRTKEAADAAAAAGNKPLAREIRQDAKIHGPAPTIVDKQNIEGTTPKKRWECHIVDLKAFAIAAPGNEFLWAAILSVEPELQKWAQRQAATMKSALNNYPGLEAKEVDDIQRSRSA